MNGVGMMLTALIMCRTGMSRSSGVTFSGVSDAILHICSDDGGKGQ